MQKNAPKCMIPKHEHHFPKANVRRKEGFIGRGYVCTNIVTNRTQLLEFRAARIGRFSRPILVNESVLIGINQPVMLSPYGRS